MEYNVHEFSSMVHDIESLSSLLRNILLIVLCRAFKLFGIPKEVLLVEGEVRLDRDGSFIQEWKELKLLDGSALLLQCALQFPRFEDSPA
jgi:hypothetical protein